MRKFDVTSLLGGRYGYRTYLEICTTATGLTFPCVNRALFTDPKRALYRCPADFQDGFPIHFRSVGPGDRLFGKLKKIGIKYDVVFLDPWHTYRDSIRDIHRGLAFVKAGGVMVVHDCNPPETSSLAPEPPSPFGEWSGVTYAAFVDFALDLAGISYITVDDDYGCGIVSMDERFASFSSVAKDLDLEKKWYELLASGGDRRAFFLEHRKKLLRLVSPEKFTERLKA